MRLQTLIQLHRNMQGIVVALQEEIEREKALQQGEAGTYKHVQYMETNALTRREQQQGKPVKY